MAAQRSASMAALDRQLKAQHPGIVVGWIRTAPGDTSDHYPDDTPGLPAAQSDADTLQEVRALDPMIGPAFTTRDADQLVRDLLLPSARARLSYVIWNRQIVGRHTHWTLQPYTGKDPHTNHVHISGWAGDDSNGSAWTLSGGAPSMALEAELNAYVDAYAGGPGQTSPHQRKVRDDWRGLLGTDPAAAAQLAEAVEALVGATANLANRITALEQAVAAITPGTGGGLTPMNQAQAYRAAADTLDPQ